MKKIMFNDKYGLTKAVLEGRKTMTRRVIAFNASFNVPAYKIGDEVAIAQKYRDLCNCDAFYDAVHKADPTFPLECIKDEKGCDNKMFVKAEWMPHRIRITNAKLERLQDISEEDAVLEGIFEDDKLPLLVPWLPHLNPYRFDTSIILYRRNARDAFAYLIDKISGYGTWRRNPWVFAYEFRLLR